MNLIRCDKCGKEIKKEHNEIKWKRLGYFTIKLDFCEKCIKEILHYKYSKEEE